MGNFSVRALGEICKVVSGATPKSSVREYWDGNIPWITPRDLSGFVGSYVKFTSRSISESGLNSCSAVLLPEGSVLLSSRAPIGYVAINSVPMATNQGFKSLIPDTSVVHPEYLLYWLRGNRSYLETLGRGATFKEISKKVVESVQIPLPSLIEQRKIADFLERIDALRTKRRKSAYLLDELAESIFNDSFARHLEGGSSTFFVGLEEVADISSGITKGRKIKEPNESLRRVPYLAVANVQDRRLDLSNVKQILATKSEISRFRIRQGDLLLTEGGDPDKLGRGVLWGGEIDECIHQNHIFRVRVKDDSLLSPLYLSWLVSSRWGKAYFLRSAKQTTGIASINKTQLGKFPVFIPDFDVQEEFALRIARISVLSKKYEAHLARLDELFASVQQRAFRGDLWADFAA